MDITLNEEQRMLTTMARNFLAKECPKKLVRDMVKDEKGYSPELWQKMAEIGWLGFVIPEEHGGTSGSFMDLALLLEEMGRACLPGPFFSTVVLGALPIIRAGTEEQKRNFLPKISSGKMILTLALTEPGVKFDAASIRVRATSAKDDYIIDGAKLFVPDAQVADYLICVTRTKDGADQENGITLFLVDAKTPGIVCTPLKTMAGDKQYEVVFEKVRVPKKNMLGELDRGWEEVKKILQQAAVGKCSEMVGAARRALEMTVDYAKERTQFDRPIGSFQAVQHHCANMTVDVDASTFIAYEAAWRLSEGLPCAMEVAMAKAWVSDACRRVCALGHQVHGAVSFGDDHDLHLYTKRVKTAEVAFGNADFHLEALAQELGL